MPYFFTGCKFFCETFLTSINQTDNTAKYMRSFFSKYITCHNTHVARTYPFLLHNVGLQCISIFFIYLLKISFDCNIKKKQISVMSRKNSSFLCKMKASSLVENSRCFDFCLFSFVFLLYYSVATFII